MSRLYLEALESPNLEQKTVKITLESLIVLFIYEHTGRPGGIALFIIERQSKSAHQGPKESQLTALPAIVSEQSTIISGLCAVCRAVIKKLPDPGYLLGFKNGCLLSPSESSIWTKFCEVDLILFVKDLFSVPLDTEELILTNTIARFERHMEQPVRVHNVKRIENELAKMKLVDEKADLPQASVPEEPKLPTDRVKVPRINKTRKKKPKPELKTEILSHTFVEGHLLTLADLIIFIGYFLILRKVPQEKISKDLPLTVQWFQNMSKAVGIGILDGFLCNQEHKNRSLNDTKFTVEPAPNVSLYKSDPKRYKPRKKLFTKQDDIESVLRKVNEIPVDLANKTEFSPGRGLEIDWNKCLALPEVGDLPIERVARKREQLQSLAREVISMAKSGDTIVDFCCGSGHLGIVIASLLPDCHVVLLENKEESLDRAKIRCKALNLINLTFLQSNLDYYSGEFQIGVSLHACGVVTDIVLDKCMEQGANFVSCPCCYGAIHDMHHLTYPRSDLFKRHEISGSDYFCVAHCSDQAHDSDKGPCNKEKSDQGQICMDIVDTDRKFKAVESGYDVILTKLEPENCTQKNRLLVGRFVKKE